MCFAFSTTFGGMCSWRRVAVARVFALVMRCRVMMLLLNSRVGKNRDTRRGSPAGAGAGRTADHSPVLFSQQDSRATESQLHIPTCCAQLISFLDAGNNNSIYTMFFRFVAYIHWDRVYSVFNRPEYYLGVWDTICQAIGPL